MSTFADGTPIPDEPVTEPVPCTHPMSSRYREAPDPSVGLFGWVNVCEECGTDCNELDEDEDIVEDFAEQLGDMMRDGDWR